MSRILVVDDDEGMRGILLRQLRVLGHQATAVPGGNEALEALRSGTFGVVITDVRMPGIDGMQLCQRVQVEHPDVPVIVITGFGSMEMAVSAMRVGAWDFLRKPFDQEELELALDRALSHRRLQSEVQQLRRVTRGENGPGGLIGASPKMQALFDTIGRVGATNATVLIQGQSGVGKERVARALHSCSARSGRPMVAVSCAVLPEDRVDSELFGHDKGVGGVDREREGLFRAADRGTLFLDEVAELPAASQARLLRVIEERRVRPVGRDREVPVDVRLIAATNVDLQERVAEGRFRKDLYYRLAVLELAVPPLAERGDDVLLLGAHFLSEQSRTLGRELSWDDGFEDALLRWMWPGNVRELRNVIEAAAALSPDGVLTAGQLPPAMAEGWPRAVAVPTAEESVPPPLSEVERRHVLRVMRFTEGNRSQAARILGIDRKTLLSRLKRYDWTDD